MVAKGYDIGMTHGRFQVLHNDHLKYIMAGKRLCRHLVVGITNPDPFLTRMEDADSERNSPIANPLTYYERYVLVNAVLREAGLMPHQFSVVPFPINFPELYKYYMPMDAVFFLTIYDEWGRQKLRYFKNLGLETHILRNVPKEEKGISATEVRRLMMEGRPWEHLVPPGAARLLGEWDIPSRLREINLKA